MMHVADSGFVKEAEEERVTIIDMGDDKGVNKVGSGVRIVWGP